MVEAGIAEEVEEAIQYDAGSPTKFKLTHPKFLLFVDETGCNTNQLNDGKVGGELYLMQKIVAMQLHQQEQQQTFTLQCCPSSLGQEILCYVQSSSKVICIQVKFQLVGKQE
jgi:hypothetical protein